MKIDNLSIKGQKLTTTANEGSDDFLVLKDYYIVSGVTRGFAETHKMGLDDQKNPEEKLKKIWLGALEQNRLRNQDGIAKNSYS